MQQIKGVLEGTGSLEEAREQVATLGLSKDSLVKQLGRALYDADKLAVETFRKEVEAELTAEPSFAEAPPLAPLRGWQGRGLPFKEAIEHFNSRAFRITEDVTADLLDGMKKRVSQAIEDGTTLEEFRASIDQMFNKAGYTRLAAYRIEAIYRNNLATAYQAGRYRQMTDPDVMEALPLWRYVAVMDGRTRPSHFAMHGRVFPADSPIWAEWYPPNGYNCRCDVMAVSLARAEHEGWQVEKRMRKTFDWPDEETNKTTRLPLVPDKGWNILPTLEYAEAA